VRRASLACAASAISVSALVSCAPALELRVHDDKYEACGRRSAAMPPPEGMQTATGTIQQIVDGTGLDGPVKIVVIDPSGRPRKLFFGSLYTIPSPSLQRQATYRAIEPSRVGDCVRADGSLMDNGSLWIERFVDFDRSP